METIKSVFPEKGSSPSARMKLVQADDAWELSMSDPKRGMQFHLKVDHQQLRYEATHRGMNPVELSVAPGDVLLVSRLQLGGLLLLARTNGQSLQSVPIAKFLDGCETTTVAELLEKGGYLVNPKPVLSFARAAEDRIEIRCDGVYWHKTKCDDKLETLFQGPGAEAWLACVTAKIPTNSEPAPSGAK